MVSAANAVSSQVLALVAQKFKANECVLTPRTDLKRDLGADSLDLVEFVILLESEFAVDIPDEDLAGINTVQELIDYLAENHQRCNCSECLLHEARQTRRRIV